MDSTTFEYLLEKVAPIIKKNDTHFRPAISPAEKLMVTLRFLATGDSYQSLMYLFRISASTISLFVPEVCLAIYTALKEYIKRMYSQMVELVEPVHLPRLVCL
ncbi:hypothetical protein MSG28_002640 [Choristoneura fumiferana]|uniref:Uncharacterized protein n=1 Tax=Choristoneura fumiferana TaxID=7141 RepID=A0ACC0JIM9_CHOFU|nr:hypothetical protein MSG28_002640 [Choristoneura fumiferana]